MDEQTTHPVHEPPVMVEVGQFSEDISGDSGESEEFVLPFSDEE